MLNLVRLVDLSIDFYLGEIRVVGKIQIKAWTKGYFWASPPAANLVLAGVSATKFLL